MLGVEPGRTTDRSGHTTHFKKSLNQQQASPRSPLSPECQSCGSVDLPIDDDVNNMIKLCQNNCYTENLNDAHLIRGFSTSDTSSKADEDIKEVIIVEDKKMVHHATPTSKNKKGDNTKGSGVLSTRSKLLERNKTDKCNTYKPPNGKKRATKSSGGSIFGYFPYKEKSSNNRSSNGSDDEKKRRKKLDLGPYLMKKATDAISTGDHLKALELALRAKTSFEECGGDETKLEYIQCLNLLASMYYNLGEQNEVISLLERSIDVPNIELGPNHAFAKFVACMQLGDLYALHGHIEKSLLHYRYGLEIQRQALGDKDPRFGETCRYVAEAHVQAFDFDEAEKFCQMALDIHKEKRASFPFEEAANRRLMGLICESKGEHESALEQYMIASAIMPRNGQELDVMAVDCNIGDAYLALGRYDEAISSYKKALSAFKSMRGKNHPAVALVLIRLAELYNKVGKFSDSISYCEKAIQIYKKLPDGPNTEDIASGLIDIAAIYESMNKLDQSLVLLHQALEMYGDAPAKHCTTAGIEAQMGVIYYMLENYVDSYDYLRSAVSKFQVIGEKRSSLYAITLNQLGLACVQLSEKTEAAEYFEEARGILNEEYGHHHPDTLGVHSNLAATYDALGRWDDAIDILEFIVSMREEMIGTADPVADDEKKRLSDLLKEAGRVRRRKCRSLMTLLDNNHHTAVCNIPPLI